MKKKQLIAILFSLIFVTTGASIASAKESVSISKTFIEASNKRTYSDKSNAKSISTDSNNKFILSSEDYDHTQWAKFSIPDDGAVTITLDKFFKNSSKETPIWIKIEDEKGEVQSFNREGVDNYTSSNDSSKNYVLGLKAGTYYLNLSTEASVKSTVNINYRIQYEKRDDYEKEKNDSFDTANAIDINKIYKGSVEIGDSDTFKLRNDCLDLVVSLKKEKEKSSAAVSFYDEAKQLISPKNKESLDGSTDKYYFGDLRPGKYYVSVSSYEQGVDSYSLKVEKCTSGWVSESGKTYYYRFGKRITGLNKIGQEVYLFDESGAIQTGWVKIGGNWKYFNENGTMRTGWLSYNGSWYFLDGNGDICKGLFRINGAIYYCNESGVMQTGWVNKGAWRYFNSDGVMQTGWLKQSGKWYYLNSSGDMVTGYNFIDYTWYYFNGDGTCAYRLG